MFDLKTFKKDKKNVLRIAYGGISLILVLLAVSIPQLITDNAGNSDFSLAKDIVQKILIATLAASIWVSAKLYQKNLDQIRHIQKLKNDNGELEADLLDAIKHIGSVNIRLDAIKSALAAMPEYPKSKQDIKKILEFFAQKILTIANIDWTLIRLVEVERSRTIREHIEVRVGKTFSRQEISNSALAQKNKDLLIISSDKSNLLFKTYCLMPKTKMRDEEDLLIKAILNQLEMIFIIFTSRYYKNDEK